MRLQLWMISFHKEDRCLEHLLRNWHQVHKTILMINKHRFRWCAVRKQAIAWTFVNPDSCHRMAPSVSLVLKELITWVTQWWFVHISMQYIKRMMQVRREGQPDTAITANYWPFSEITIHWVGPIHTIFYQKPLFPFHSNHAWINFLRDIR